MVCLRITLVLALAMAAGAQAPTDLFESAPPQVDQALRARVARFYQAHVDGKFRVADQVVAEDSKDAFFAADKPRYKSFEIVKITYADGYASARVLTVCDTEMVSPMTGRIPMKAPMTSMWKVTDGEWFLHIPPKTGAVDSPFGTMAAGQDSGAGSAPMPARLPDVDSVLRMVSVDRREIELSSYEPAEAEATVSNRMPGAIDLSLSYSGFPGFEARLERSRLASAETAKVVFRCQPADKSPKPTLTVVVRVEQTQQEFPIRVTFRVPPETRLPNR